MNAFRGAKSGKYWPRRDDNLWPRGWSVRTTRFENNELTRPGVIWNRVLQRAEHFNGVFPRILRVPSAVFWVQKRIRKKRENPFLCSWKTANRRSGILSRKSRSERQPNLVVERTVSLCYLKSKATIDHCIRKKKHFWAKLILPRVECDREIIPNAHCVMDNLSLIAVLYLLLNGSKTIVYPNFGKSESDERKIVWTILVFTGLIL